MKLIRFQAVFCLIALYIASVSTTEHGEVDGVVEQRFREFLRRHVVDPELDKDWETWTSAKWNTLLQDILGNRYGTLERRKHTFLIAEPRKLLRTFKHSDKLETKDVKNDRTDMVETMHWSRNRFQMVYMEWVKESYLPFIVTHEMQFLAALNGGRKGSSFPVHFQGQKSKKINLGGEMPDSLMGSPYVMTVRQYAEFMKKFKEEQPKRKRPDEVTYDQNKYVKSK